MQSLCVYAPAIFALAATGRMSDVTARNAWVALQEYEVNNKSRGTPPKY